MKRARDPQPVSRVPGLAAAKTVGEAYDAVVQAFDQGHLDPAEARVAIELLKVRSTVVAAEEFSKRLALAEATAREAQRRALPARKATVDVEPSPSDEAEL